MLVQGRSNKLAQDSQVVFQHSSGLAGLPRFEEIPEPRMVCFGVGNGSGSKLFQSYLDGHPEIYMVPGYQIMYLYPHWQQWEQELQDAWEWGRIIDEFCLKHGSVIDSRRIPGNDGLTTLGENRDEWISIDEEQLKACLSHLLDGRPITSRDFILALHYAYAFTLGEDLSCKRVIVYHIHVHEYVRFLYRDFPGMLTLAFVRDPRSNLKGRYQSDISIDVNKLNPSDVAIYRRRRYYTHWCFYMHSLERLRGLDPSTVRAIRHEDMHRRLDTLLQNTATFLGIQFHPCLQQLTFGGKTWWGDRLYKMKPMNKPNPSVVAEKWKKELDCLDWFVLEGIFADYCNRYGYTLYKYKEGFWARVKLFFAMFLPSKYEREICRFYFNFNTLKSFLIDSYGEATGKIELKDYTFNAFYRHKWSNQGVNLSKVRWHVGLLNVVTGSSLNRNRFTRMCIVVCYMVANITRYIGSVVSFPFLVLHRGWLSFSSYISSIHRDQVLPRPLVPLPRRVDAVRGVEL